MSIESIGAIIFIVLMGAFLFYERKKITVQKIFFPLLYFVMYRTQVGLGLMNTIGTKWKKTLKVLAPISIIIGFLGMALICYALIDNVINLFFAPEAVPEVGLVLPIKAKGVFFVPFFFWIISIFIIAVVHEFSHGVFARYYGMKIKSAGLAFLNVVVPVIPAAFVEPDEKEIVKRPAKEQLAVYSAGPFSNVVLAFIVLGIVAFVIGPFANSLFVPSGVQVTGFLEGSYPAQGAGIGSGEIITSIDSTEVTSLEGFSGLLEGKKANQAVNLTTNASQYTVLLGEHPEKPGKGYLGVLVQQHTALSDAAAQRYGSFVPSFTLWILQLFYFLYILNLGIGLFNLAPIGPLDGGRMLLVTLEKFFDKKKAVFYWKRISFFFLVLILITLAFAFIR